MLKRRTLFLLFSVCCVLLLLTTCGAAQGSPTPADTGSPPFRETTPLIIHPPLFQVNNVAWSTDGKRIAVANADGVFQVWNAVTGRLVSTHYQDGRSTKILLLGWTSDGKSIISSATYGNTVQVWDAATGKTRVTFNNPDRSSALIASPSHEGKYVAMGSGSVLQLWDTSTGKQVSTFDTKTERIESIAWSPDDSLLVTTNAQKKADGTSEYHIAQVWRVTTGVRVCTYQNTSTSYIDHLAWSPDHRRIVSISGTGLGNDPVITQVWDAATCAPIFRLHGTLAQAADLSWSPDRTHIASWESTNGPLQVWDAATGNLSFTVGGQYLFVSSLAWSPDGKKIAVVGEPLKMQVFDVATGQPQITYQVDENQNIVTWSPDGQHLASIGMAGTTIWQANADHRVTAIAGRHQIERAVSWSPDGTQIAAEDGSTLDVGFWDTATGANMGDHSVYHEQMLFFFYRNTVAVAWSPDGAHVAQAMFPSLSDIHVFVWGSSPSMCGLDENCPVSGGSHSALITALAWSPDSKFIASASLDKTVLIYDVANQKDLVLYQGHTDAVTAVAWSPDGKYLASGSADKTVQIWNAVSGKRLLTLRGHTDAVTGVAWSPDGKRVASSSEDGTVRIWDAVHGKLFRSYRGHKGAVMAVAWSPDGQYIASAGADTTVRVWYANTGRTAFIYRGHTNTVLAVAWSPDSKRVASSGKDGTIQIW